MGSINWLDNRADFEDKPLLTAEERETLADSGEPFRVTACRLTKTKVGETFFVDVLLTGGKKATLPFGSKPGTVRDTNLAGLIEYFDQNGNEPLSFRLRSFDTRFDRKGFDLVPI